MKVYDQIIKSKKLKRKQFAILVDPDKISIDGLELLCNQAIANKVNYIFIGGSLLSVGNVDICVKKIKSLCHIPTVLFPGDPVHISKHADSILLLSLISGRNPEMLIGRHIVAAPMLKSSQLEVIPTGYMLIDSGASTSASYMSNTNPIPYDKNDIAMCTAIAGEMLGLKLLFLDGGSGAQRCISPNMIKAVSETVSIPILIGGGIHTPQKAREIWLSGADVIVVGNAIEKDHTLISLISKELDNLNNSSTKKLQYI